MTKDDRENNKKVLVVLDQSDPLVINPRKRRRPFTSIFISGEDVKGLFLKNSDALGGLKWDTADSENDVFGYEDKYKEILSAYAKHVTYGIGIDIGP